jgi:hypothetical protein
VDNALRRVGIADIADAEFGRIALQRGKLLRAVGIGNGNAVALRVAARGRQVVIGHGQRQIGAAHLAPGKAERLERLGARHFVNEVAVDIDQAGAIIAVFHDVGVPDLFVERLAGARVILVMQERLSIAPVHFKHERARKTGAMRHFVLRRGSVSALTSDHGPSRRVPCATAGGSGSRGWPASALRRG